MSKFSLNVWSLIAIVAALALAAFSPVANAAGPEAPKPAAIAGMVQTTDGAPVGAAEVRLINADGKVVRITHTGPKGHFEFAPIPPGRYLVAAGKPAVGRGQEKAIAPPGTVTKVKITLKK